VNGGIGPLKIKAAYSISGIEPGTAEEACAKHDMESEISRWRCITDDETHLIVIEHQHRAAPVPGEPSRHYPGARRFALSTGDDVRYIDATSFEIIATGEILRRID
jgi:hypothetical protein